MTELLYLKQQNLFKTTAKLLSHNSDAKGQYVLLDQTIFYPQGGGQPADHGKLIFNDLVFIVIDVRVVENEVRHYIITSLQDDYIMPINNEIVIEVNKDRRLLNTKYHTAGHLLASVIESIYLNARAIKGHQFPGEAYVEFTGDFTITNIEKLNNELDSVIKENELVQIKILDETRDVEILTNLPYEVPKDKALRICSIANFMPVPCGGTHVESLMELGKVTVTKIKNKQGSTKISYTLL